jgi:signal transduction histidine kinase
MTLRAQLSLILLLVTFFPVATLTYLDHEENVEHVTDSKDVALEQAQQNVTRNVNAYVKNLLDGLWADSNAPGLAKYLSMSSAEREAAKTHIYGILRSIALADIVFINSVSLLDQDGMNIADTDIAQEGLDESKQPYFISAYQNKSAYFSHSLNFSLGGAYLYASSPIRNQKSQIVGVLRLRIDPSVIQQIVRDTLKGTNFQSIVLDSTGMMLANLDEPSRLLSKSTEINEDVARTPLWESSANNPRRYLRYSLSDVPWIVSLYVQGSEYKKIEQLSFEKWRMQLAFIFIAVLIATLFVSSLFVYPLRRVGRAAEKIAAGDLEYEVPVTGSSEVRRMARSLRKMTSTLATNLTELRQRHEAQTQVEKELVRLNLKLEKNIKKRTTELEEEKVQKGEAVQQLIQSERMASLGSMVAGVTHEINTPIGNNVTVASSLKSQVEALQQKFESGALKKSDMSAFMSSCLDATEIIEKNCFKASELMGGFKRVAVDQASMRRRKFSPRESVQEVLTTMHHKLKKTNHNITLNMSEDVWVDSFPGPFDQVITNLVDNSLIHGFEGIADGEITISSSPEEKDGVAGLKMTYADNGKGIPSNIIDKVFDPFFTTKADSGGSGMGLYLIKSMVEESLGGVIEIDRDYADGARYQIWLPLTGPSIDVD